MPTHRLWTPIANALEAYRRRVVVKPEAEYEHIWRLIHIQEALAVSLASLMATRLADVFPDGPTGEPINVLREALTGLRPDAVGSDDDDDVEPSPWGGSIGAWIELLRRFGKTAMEAEDPFLAALAGYLSSTPNRPLAFADAWARIAPVPATFRDPALDRVGRLGAINSFRNKLAHVPVSQRLLGDLHRGLRVEVLDGLTAKFNPETDTNSPGFIATSYREPLVGILYCGNTYVTGGSEVGIDGSRDAASSELAASYGKASTVVEWPVEPFFRIDAEAKTALLFRVTDLQREPGATGYGGEYHRFDAEMEPVTYVAIPAEAIQPWIPRSPAVSVNPLAEPLTGQPEVEQSSVPAIEVATEVDRTPRELRRLAEEAFSRRDYGSAVASFDALAQQGDPSHYNDVARSKHGAALWRAAERTAVGLDLQASLEKAVALLRRAERHRDSLYAARSAYEGSKALWHLWRATKDSNHLLEALAAAERAVARSPDEAFISWQARVKRDVDVAFPQGISELPSARTTSNDDPTQSFETRANESYQASNAHGSSGKYAEAAASAQEAVQLNPSHTGAWRSLATNLSQMGQHEKAREAWRALDELVGTVPVDYKSAAYNALLDARTDWSSAAAWDHAAKMYDKEGRGSEVVAEARKVLAAHPEAHASLLSVVEWLVNQLPEEVRELVADMRTINPMNAHYIHLDGVAKRKAGLEAEAADDLRLACERAPLNPNYWYALGRCMEDAGNFGDACNAFKRAIGCGDPPHRKAQEHLNDLRASGRCADKATEAPEAATTAG